MDPVKLAAGAGAAALVLGGGGYGISILFVNSEMPGYSPFVSSGTGTIKYVDEYPDYFVDATKGKNAPWWDWVYKKRYLVDSENKDFDGESRPDPKLSFMNLNAGSGETSQSIQKVCEGIFSADKGKVKSGANQSGEYEEIDVWRYCTAVKKKPILVEHAKKDGNSATEKEDAEYTEATSYGKQYKSQLVATSAEENKFFWKEQQRLFFQVKGNRSGSSSEDTDSIFKKLYDEHKGKKNIPDNVLRDKCRLAYGKKKDGSGINPKAIESEVFTYCSLKRSKSG
ncbi:hypothetical protein [Candidatus Mycoplasma haematohominis]|uniref:hypothetical protein n=1 Tax=Candidatus Mycoplasma haematohominis TaxID=1494318 RepID=UPI001C0A7292|nr:hypothetical protein [Candidatus Mycoplasma haemohominis]